MGWAGIGAENLVREDLYPQAPIQRFGLNLSKIVVNERSHALALNVL